MWHKLEEKDFSKRVDFANWFLKLPPDSPDLNPCDSFQWGHLKSKVYNPLPKTLDDLKANIEREIKKISKNILNSSIFKF
jgi:hypothetical protein